MTEHPLNAVDYENLDVDTYDFASCVTRRQTNYDKTDVAAAIIKTHGNFADMSMLLGRNRNRVRDFVLANPDMKEILDNVREGMLDGIESSTFQMALAGDGPSQRFLLSTLGKNRGYATRVESTGPDGAVPVTVNLTLEEAREEARRRGLPERVFDV